MTITRAGGVPARHGEDEARPEGEGAQGSAQVGAARAYETCTRHVAARTWWSSTASCVLGRPWRPSGNTWTTSSPGTSGGCREPLATRE